MKTTPMLIAITGCALALTACVSPQELHAMDQNACASFGFQPGTDGFAKCMMKQSEKRSQENRARMEEAQKQLNAPAQPAAPSTTVIVIPADGKAKLPDCRMQDPGVTLNSDGKWVGPNCTPAN
ncbi:hypothetical protein [Chromobacterium amazonense]|uniref:Lipoprotein n=1 Tax=Chromobacterium amazonense TaxID=1382803 RepID=A0ABU8V1Y1_9NEIS|nr:hypothetical protein [Chromobacterium amazonense]MBM2886533.1 hypothetical protein [Chromobacterium amazonense]MDQ4539491.1 hypothetical protein [Chromobacterium amazonense]